MQINQPIDHDSSFNESTKAMIDEALVNFKMQQDADISAMETRLRMLMLGILEKPVNLMRDQHLTLERLKEVGAGNHRRLNELEFSVHKFTRSIGTV